MHKQTEETKLGLSAVICATTHFGQNFANLGARLVCISSARGRWEGFLFLFYLLPDESLNESSFLRIPLDF